MLTADQQRVKDLLRETITLLCKNGLHFQSEFHIDGLIGITLDRKDVFLVTIKETVHSGDVFIRDSKRKHPDDHNRCYEDKRRLEHRKNNVSVKSELSKDDLSHRKLEHLSVIDARQRKSSMQSRVEAAAKPKNLMGHDEANVHSVKCGDDINQHHGKGFSGESALNDLTLDESNNSGNEGSEQEKPKGGCFSDIGQEIGLMLDSEMDDKKGFQRSMSTENQDDDNGDDSDYRRNDDEEDEPYRSRRDEDDDDNDGSSKADFIRKTNSHKFLSPTISSAAVNNLDENDEEPLVVKVEPPDTSYNPYPSSQRSDLDFDGEGWGSNQHHRGHPNASQPGSSRHYPNVNDVFSNSSSTAFRNATKPYIQNAGKGQQMASPMFNDNVQLHQQMLNTRQQPQQQRNSNYNELFTSLVDISQNQGFPGDEFLTGGGDFLHVASQQFPPHQQMNRLLQRRQRSTFTRTQVKCLEDVFKTVHYVDASLRMKLSRQLNLSEGTINIWFQNRRQKLKKQQQQMMMNSNPPGVANDESLLGGGDMNTGGPSQVGGDFIVNQSPGRPSNSSFSGSNAGSSPAYMQSPIHNNPPSSTHNAQFNPMDQCPNFSFNSEPGKT